MTDHDTTFRAAGVTRRNACRAMVEVMDEAATDCRCAARRGWWPNSAGASNLRAEISCGENGRLGVNFSPAAAGCGSAQKLLFADLRVRDIAGALKRAAWLVRFPPIAVKLETSRQVGFVPWDQTARAVGGCGESRGRERDSGRVLSEDEGLRTSHRRQEHPHDRRGHQPIAPAHDRGPPPASSALARIRKSELWTRGRSEPLLPAGRRFRFRGYVRLLREYEPPALPVHLVVPTAQQVPRSLAHVSTTRRQPSILCA